MKLLMSCGQCVIEAGSSIGIPTRDRIGLVSVRDDGQYEITCPKGHRTIVRTREPKFEILFEIGACAIVDGYPREAVSSFAASLERFYEFATRFIVRESGIEGEFYDAGRKAVQNQSERQLGAFIFTFMIFYKSMPKVLSEKMVKLRNSVIHKGEIPSEADAIHFGNEVIACVAGSAKRLHQSDPEGFKYQYDFIKASLGTVDSLISSTLSLPTILGRENILAGGGQLELETHLPNLRRDLEVGLR